MTDQYGFATYPWEVLENETAQQYAAFIMYRDLGPRRSMRAAAAKYYDLGEAKDVDPKSGKIRTFERWSSANRWVARAEEWDLFLQHQADIDEVAAVKAMRERHVNITTVMQSKAIQYLNTITDADLKRMTPDTAMRMLDLAIKNERLARGVPDTIQAQTNADGSKIDSVVRMEISDEALERRFEAWQMANDPDNEIERGEPVQPATDDLGLEDDEE